METLKAGGWITDIKYADEIEEDLKKRTGGKEDKVLAVDYKRYSRVKEKTLGLTGALVMVMFDLFKISIFCASCKLVGGFVCSYVFPAHDCLKHQCWTIFQPR